MKTMITAGVASVDITPATGLELAGYPHAPRHNTGAHDPLYATCLYLSDGVTRLAIVGLDLLFFSKKHVKTVGDRVEKLTGIPASHLMFSCSHSHSTPWASGRLDLEALESGVRQDEGFIAELCDKLTHLIVSATRTAFPARIGYAAGHCGREQGVGGNRRDPVNGPCDPAVYTLLIRDASETVRTVLVNYAVHPTVLHAENTLCSGDYVGALRGLLREKYPHAQMIFGLGASGDQSTRFFRSAQTFEEAGRIGLAIGNAAVAAAESAEWETSPRLFVKTAEFAPRMRTLPSRAEAEARLAERAARWEALKATGASYTEVQSAHVNLFGAEDILGYILANERGEEIELARDELPAVVTLFGIGGARILGLPGEVFMGIAQAIRRESASNRLIINTVSNGCLPGYCYTAEDAALGGYEVDTSMLDEKTGDLLVRVSADLLREAGVC